MDLTSIFLFCLISLVIGAVLMILVQYYVFVKYFNQPDNDQNASNRSRSLNERYQLPDVSFLNSQYLIQNKRFERKLGKIIKLTALAKSFDDLSIEFQN